MRVACLIMAHKNPQQIERLVKTFANAPFDFYIHICKETPIGDFDCMKHLENVFFIQNRFKIRWASYNLLKGMLSSMEEILATGKPYDFISLMSGQDYPIKPVAAIYKHLENNKGKSFIYFEPGDSWWGHAITRINKYHFTNFGFRGRYQLQYVINAVFPKRLFPLPYVLYGGSKSSWMTLGIDCAKYVVDFVANNKKLERFASFTWAPDEFLLPTIIMNSSFRDTVINDNLYYIHWLRGDSHPKILTMDDFETLVNSDKMFARKFDMLQDSAILDMLDRKLVTGMQTA